MHLASTILGLAATVAAIDIYGYGSNEKCGGSYIVCTNVNPNNCCIQASGTIFRSIGIRAIPTEWNIIGTAYNGGYCKNELYTVQSSGRTNICLGGNYYSGGQYRFASSKRPRAASESCSNPMRPNLMVLENGSKYNLTALDHAHYEELACYLREE